MILRERNDAVGLTGLIELTCRMDGVELLMVMNWCKRLWGRGFWRYTRSADELGESDSLGDVL